jgi:hypothetical protein
MKDNASVFGNTGTTGGGISVIGNFYMLDNASVFNNTTSGNGGGVANRGYFNMQDNTSIFDNNAMEDGGGVVMNGNWTERGTFDMKDNASIYGNTARDGGGIIISYGTVNMHNNASVYGNTASRNGGGINSFFNGLFFISSGTVYGNDETGFDDNNNPLANTALNGMSLFVRSGSNSRTQFGNFDGVNYTTLTDIPRTGEFRNETIRVEGGVLLPTYTVSFNSNGGSPVPDQEVSMGTLALRPTNPVKPITGIPAEAGLYIGIAPDYNLAFLGWYEENATAPWDFNAPITKNTTLVARWFNTEGILGTTVPAGNNIIDKALNVIFANSPISEFTLIIDEDIEIFGYHYRNIGWYRLTIIGLGTERTISLSSPGRMFNITNGSLILGENITLRGLTLGQFGATQNNNSPLIHVDNNANASLTMQENSKITGNTNLSGSGGAVHVSNNGTFIIKDNAVIYGNTANRGGGVNLASGANFNKTGGIIYGYDPDDLTNSNMALNNNGGHAIWVDINPPLIRNTTVGLLQNLSFNGTNPPTYSGIWREVIFSSLTANGSAAETTTMLTLNFRDAQNTNPVNIIDLEAFSIDLFAGTTGVTKGTLTNTEVGTYTLTLNDLTASGSVNISISRDDYIIVGNNKNVEVFRKIPPGTIGITIDFWENEDGKILDPDDTNNDITISKFDDPFFNATVSASYTGIQWYINSLPVNGNPPDNRTISIDAQNFAIGTYRLGVVVLRNGIPHSSEIRFTVVE